MEGLKGVFKIADDILITGQGETEREADEDHDRNLKSLLDRCRERNIKLNKKKFTFKCDDVQFIGHRLTKEGLKPDPAKVKAILSMKKPDDVAAVQRLMGMVKYLSKFLSDLSQICEPIRRLTHKDVLWSWTKEQDVAFDKIKEAVTSAPVLKFFDSSKPTEGSGAISYPVSSGFLVSGATPGRLWGHRKNSIFLIGCSVTVAIVLPQKSCGNKIRCPQSLPVVAPLTKKPEDSGYEIGSGDASSQGLGFVLTQEDHPVTYASRALTQAEQHDSQIEKELLAQVFGLEHNHQYVYGRKVILYTDHKPLVSISRKPLASAPKRLQRLLLRLQQYDTEIRYRPGREMYLADTLSRAYLSLSPTDTQRSETQKEVESIHAVDYLAISEQQLTEIKQETAKDPTVQTLKNVILRGWPENSSSVPKEDSEYFNVRDELAVQDGIIFKGQRCVIPKTLRQKVKEKIHRAHIGIQGCLRRAREVVYWPSMNQDITDYIEHCDTCNMYASHPQREPLIVHDVPERPWQKVGCDIFTLDENDYLCTVDYYSGYFEINHLERKTARPIVTRLKRHFSNHGIPNLFQSDNGPPFDSQEFRDFAAAYEFELVTSSPNYPQSNGRVENAVKTAKQLMKKSKQAGTDFYLALLDWRNTPTEGVGCSPMQRLCGRRTRTLLPTATSPLKPTTTPGVREKLLKKKERQTYYYNRGTRELSPLRKGDAVVMLPSPQARKWKKAEVEDQVDVRSYAVLTKRWKSFSEKPKAPKEIPSTPSYTHFGSGGPAFKDHGYVNTTSRRSGKGL